MLLRSPYRAIILLGHPRSSRRGNEPVKARLRIFLAYFFGFKITFYISLLYDSREILVAFLNRIRKS